MIDPAAKLRASEALVNALASRLGARVIETHISWVLLTDRFAYKLKKPVRLPFLDFSTLARRRHFCGAEVRVNQALAASLYLGVVPVTGRAEEPELDGAGRVLDYAVAMKRFADGALFSERLAAGLLRGEDVDRLAGLLAAAHAEAAILRRRGGAGALQVHERALAALSGAEAAFSAQQRDHLRRWLDEGASRLEPQWRSRRGLGHVRECHGDLHLANLVMLDDGRPAAFDAIEFDPALRWIDVVEDAAFPAMDFAALGRPDFCWRFLNAWLDAAGEHEAAGVLRYALVYRALVRAEVACMRDGRPQADAYARAALHWSMPGRPRLVITHGLPGSGKTFQSQRLLEREGAIRLRSDVERKRLFGLSALQRSSAAGLDIYGGDSTERTYQRLFELARCVLAAGFDAVIDAAFLRRGERDAARALARECGASFAILACEAPREVLRQRIADRVGDASEADASVMERLGDSMEALGPDEQALTVPHPGS